MSCGVHLVSKNKSEANSMYLNIEKNTFILSFDYVITLIFVMKNMRTNVISATNLNIFFLEEIVL